MRSLAKAYRTLKKESPNFRLTKDEFLIYVMCLFPMLKAKCLVMPITRRVTVGHFVGTGKEPVATIEVVKVNFEDLADYLNKRIVKLQRKT